MPVDRLRGLLDAFGRVDAVGESFTVYKVGDLDVSLPRRESKTGRGHTGFLVTGDPTLSPIEAARRRDFTINAIAFDPLLETFVDPFRGPGRHGRPAAARVVDPATFGDDSLRVLRALQLAARFELTVDRRPRRPWPGHIPLDDLPSERIWGEIEETAPAQRRASRRSVWRSRSSWASSTSCSRPSEPSWGVRRNPSGIRRATSGRTRCWSWTRLGDGLLTWRAVPPSR